VRGEVRVRGSVAYLAQTAWIFNGTVKDNILFGKAYDPDLFSRGVIDGWIVFLVFFLCCCIVCLVFIVVLFRSVTNFRFFILISISESLFFLFSPISRRSDFPLTRAVVFAACLEADIRAWTQGVHTNLGARYNGLPATAFI
jgi:ABC-type multidrug transport system fused ATPase/permease subunit